VRFFWDNRQMNNNAPLGRFSIGMIGCCRIILYSLLPFPVHYFQVTQ
jgi:hypothetical protein